jgi:hypothetical protein
MSLLLAQPGPAGMSAIAQLLGEKRTSGAADAKEPVIRGGLSQGRAAMQNGSACCLFCDAGDSAPEIRPSWRLEDHED